MWPTLETTPSPETLFHHPGHVPVIRGNPNLHFEDAGNGPVLITFIGRVHELYTCALRSHSLNIVSLSDMTEGSYRSWYLYTTGQLVDGLQQKKKTSFHLTEMESCRLF